MLYPGCHGVRHGHNGYGRWARGEVESDKPRRPDGAEHRHGDQGPTVSRGRGMTIGLEPESDSGSDPIRFSFHLKVA